MFRMKSLAVAGALVLTFVLLGSGSATATVINIVGRTHCNVNGQRLQVSLTAGTYKATLIQGTYTSWKWTNNSLGTWNTLYQVLVSDGTTEYTGGNWVDASTALDGYLNTPNKELLFHQPVDGIAQFYVADNNCVDNSGGVSLELIIQPVPTQSSTWGKIKGLYRK